MKRKALGSWGEAQALGFLENQGMQLICRNFRVREGEIDLIMEDGGILVFVEVKTRISMRFGTPEESITKAKMARIYRAAHQFLELKEAEHTQWRVDVVVIESSPALKLIRLDHYPNIEVSPP